jgi:hypothetical protein
MSRRSNPILGAALAAALSLPFAAVAQPADAVHLPADTVTTVAGIKAACTGVGLNARDDPRWKAFAVRMEVAKPGGDYLGEETLAVQTAAGKPVLSVSCGSPWVLLDLPPGAYKVTAWSGSHGPKDMTIHAPAHGQARFVVVFS